MIRAPRVSDKEADDDDDDGGQEIGFSKKEAGQKQETITDYHNICTLYNWTSNSSCLSFMYLT